MKTTRISTIVCTLVLINCCQSAAGCKKDGNANNDKHDDHHSEAKVNESELSNCLPIITQLLSYISVFYSAQKQLSS